VLLVRHEPGAEARWVTTIASLLIAGVFIDALVRRVRRQHNAAVENAESLTVVVDAMQRIFQHPTADATRADLCGTALQVTRADGVALWEPRPDGVLVRSATARRETLGPALSGYETDAGAEATFASGEARFASLEDVRGGDAEFGEGHGSARWQPILRDGTPVGVLALYWQGAAAPREKHVESTVELLAAQAAIAIERAELLARLERAARTDELTGLPNRRAWEEELPRELLRAKREGSPLCVAMLDVDGLKRVNDTHGHHAGDQLLKQNAAAWSSAMRQVDLLARYGGDEFAAILPGCGMEGAQKIVERLIGCTPEGHTFCVGIAEWDGIQDAHELVALADSDLYKAKGQRPDAQAPVGGALG
jgi:diguanylate cyclase (GGDEF)-like protein